MKLFTFTIPEPLQVAARQCRPHLLLATGFSALVNILYLAPTIYMMQIYDRVVPTGGVITLFWLTLVVGFAIAILAGLEAQRGRVLQRASLRLNRLVAQDLLDRLLRRPKNGPNETSNSQAMREFDSVRQLIGSPAAGAFMDLPWTPIYLVVAFVIHPLLALLILIGAAILVGLAVRNERRGKAGANQAHSATAAAYAFQEATARASETIRALGMSQGVIALQMEKRRKGLEATTLSQFSSGRHNAFVKFVRMFLQSVSLGAGAWLAINGQISVGAIIAASVLLSRALQPIEQIVGHWQLIVQARQALTILDGLLADTAEARVNRTALPEPEGLLELDRVVVTDSQGKAILLKNISLTLKPGELLGVIGPSGAGKSTLARVAALGLAPHLGEIRIGGANVGDWDPDELARYIGYLPQRIDLLPGTVSENISRFAKARGIGSAEVDRMVVEAAQSAGIHQLILHLPQGYDTRLEDGTFALSAGQAQRVGLARALFGNPKILILDEPNSALDSSGEQALAAVTNAALKRKAAVMIVAHRAAILENADQLAVLQDGGIVQCGPRAEIMALLASAQARMNVVPIHERAQS